MTVPRFIGLLVVLFGILSGTLLVAQPFVTVADVDPFIMAILSPSAWRSTPSLRLGERRALALRVTAAALLALGFSPSLGCLSTGQGYGSRCALSWDSGSCSPSGWRVACCSTILPVPWSA